VANRLQGNGGNDVLTDGGGAGNTSEKVIGGVLGDTITGNALNNILLGGGGSDTLRGGSGRDVLIGGTGADTLLGESGDDLLIAGRTTYDNNQKSLLTILGEWTDVTKT
jgi:Ca2+-binding RTX toxin-like protein